MQNPQTLLKPCPNPAYTLPKACLNPAQILSAAARALLAQILLCTALQPPSWHGKCAIKAPCKAITNRKVACLERARSSKAATSPCSAPSRCQ